MGVNVNLGKIPGWALGGAALAIGGAALYLYFKGTKGIAKGAVGALGNAAAGAIEGTGQAFQDVTQATFGVPKTNADTCAADIAKGDTLASSFSCPAGTWLKSLFSSDAPTKTASPMTAPGGGIIDSGKTTFTTVSNGPNDGSGQVYGSGWQSFNDQAAGVGTLPGVVSGWFNPDMWAIDYAPSSPVVIGSGGGTSVVPVAGLRG